MGRMAIHRWKWRLLAALVLCCSGSAGCSAADDPQPPSQTTDSDNPARQTPLPARLEPVMAMIQAGQTDQARLRLQRYMQDHPGSGHGLFLFGLTFHVQHRYSEARDHLARARQLVPNFPPVHYFTGWCLYHLGELDQAGEAFEQHLALQSGEYDSHYALGLIALDQQRLDDAQTQFNRAIELHGEDSEHPADLGRAHGKLGQTLAQRQAYEQAKAHLTLAGELNPDDHESLYQLYRVLLQLGETDAAEQARQRHLEARERANLPTPAP